jgi:hypothetical protein
MKVKNVLLLIERYKSKTQKYLHQWFVAKRVKFVAKTKKFEAKMYFFSVTLSQRVAFIYPERF